MKTFRMDFMEALPSIEPVRSTRRKRSYDEAQANRARRGKLNKPCHTERGFSDKLMS